MAQSAILRLEFEAGHGWQLRARDQTVNLVADRLVPGAQVSVRLPPPFLWKRVKTLSFKAHSSTSVVLSIGSGELILHTQTLINGWNTVCVDAANFDVVLRSPKGGLTFFFEIGPSSGIQGTEAITITQYATLETVFDVTYLGLVLATVAVALALIVITLVAGYIPVLQSLFGQLFASLTVAVGLAIGATISASKILQWLQANFVLKMPRIAVAVSAVTAGALMSMLLDYADIQMARYRYQTRWDNLIEKFIARNGYLDPAELRTAMLDWPGRVELWSLAAMSSYRFLFIAQDDGQREAAKYFRKLLDAEAAFKQETVVGSAEPASDSFVNPHLLADRILDLCKAGRERVTRLAVLIIPFPLSRNPAAPQCQFALVLGIQALLPLVDNDAGLSAIQNTSLLIPEIENRGPSEEQLIYSVKQYIKISTKLHGIETDCQRKLASADVTGRTRECARRIAIAYDQAVKDASKDQLIVENHVYQELLAQQIHAYADYCRAFTSPKIANSVEEQKTARLTAERHILAFLSYRSSLNRSVRWASMPRRFPLHLALFVDRWAGSFPNLRERVASYFICFGDEKSLINFVRNSQIGEASDFSWWFRGTLMAKNKVSTDGDYEAMFLELNKFISKGWRL